MGFLQPSAWVWSILFGVLIVLYLRERHRRSYDVPSLLLWQDVPEVPPRTTRFTPDLLFLLRCLVLAALILGLADPFFLSAGSTAHGSRHVFILDTSASMQAREDGSTRFELARAALRSRLDSLRRGDEAMLIVADHSPHVVAPFSSEHDALTEALNRSRPVDAATDLDLALAVAHHAARSDRETTVELFTDLPHSELRRAWVDRVALQRFGESDRNVAIDALHVVQGGFQGPNEARAQVVLRNYGQSEAHGVLSLSLNGRHLERQGFSLPARGTRVFYRSHFTTSGILKAQLEIDDALAADNRAYGRIRSMRPIRLLAVSEDRLLQRDLARIAAATGNLEVRGISPTEYDEGSRDNADVVLFHGHVPASAPDRASLVVYPDEGSDWLHLEANATEVEITDWNQEHAVLQGLRPELPFPLRRARLLTLPPWADVLIATEHGGRELPLAFCGRQGGHRLAVIGFDLASDQLLHPDHLNIFLFFLRLLEWLAPADESITMLRTGEPYVLPSQPGQSFEVTDPYGRPVSLPASGPPRIEAAFAGLYDVVAGGTKSRLLANFFDPRESDIGRTREPSEAAAKADAPQSLSLPGEAAGLGFWFYAGAIVLLLLEWVAAMQHR